MAFLERLDETTHTTMESKSADGKLIIVLNIIIIIIIILAPASIMPAGKEMENYGFSGKTWWDYSYHYGVQISGW